MKTILPHKYRQGTNKDGEEQTHGLPAGCQEGGGSSGILDHLLI